MKKMKEAPESIILLGLPVVLMLLPAPVSRMPVYLVIYAAISFVISSVMRKKLLRRTETIGDVWIAGAAVMCVLLATVFLNRWRYSSQLLHAARITHFSSRNLLTLAVTALSAGALYGIIEILHWLPEKTVGRPWLAEWKKSFWTLLSQKQVKVVLITAALTAFVCYFEFLKNGFGSPDWLDEGYLLYHNAHWALSIGRWFIRYVNSAVGNVVNPALIITVCTVLQAISTLLILKLWKIEDITFSAFTTISIVAAPAVAVQNLYIYIGLDYGVALLGSTLSAWLSIRSSKRSGQIAAAILLALAMGCYQSYVGFTAGIIICTLILRIGKGSSCQEIMKKGWQCLQMGILSGILYCLSWKTALWYYGGIPSHYSGADSVSAGKILRALPDSILKAYDDFFRYYLDSIGGRCYWYIPLATIAFVLILRILRHRKLWGDRVLLAAMVIALPVMFNVIDLIATERNISEIMNHQMQLMIPFALALMNDAALTLEWKKTVRSAGVVLLLGLSLNFSICAFALYKMGEANYHFVQAVSAPIIQKIMSESENGSVGRVMFAGFPDDAPTLSANSLQRMSYITYSNVFWPEYSGRPQWRQFVYNTYGIDTGEIGFDEYIQIIESPAFNEMPCYPNEGFIQKIDDMYVVKFQNAPPKI